MLVSSPLFLFLFLPLVLTTYLILPRTLRNPFLLGASLLFYELNARAYTLILLLAILLNYALGLCLLRTPGAGGAASRPRSAVLYLILLFDLGLLVTSRYDLSFSAENGLQFIPGAVHLGVSFFALALMSYAIDVFRGRVPPARDPLRFGVYVSFFPKIVAGPIVRYQDVAGQLARPRVSRSGLAVGVQRFVIGLAKKVLIADTLALVADDIFATPGRNLTAAAAWLGTLCYGLQIYYDFSGYSDMAIGLGRMFGFEFLENFNYPYVSRSLGEFWRRWHISLSTWLRDYLYLPLAYAVSRRIPAERLLNLRAEMWAYSVATLTTMLLCGLWHRLSWGCALWGLWHGVYLIVETSRPGKKLLRRCGGPVRFLLTQWVVLMGWVVFRAGTLTQSAALFRVMYGLDRGGARPDVLVPLSDYVGRPLGLARCVGLAFCVPLAPALHQWATRRFGSLVEADPWISAIASLGRVLFLFALLLAVAMSLAGGTYSPFVYQQF